MHSLLTFEVIAFDFLPFNLEEKKKIQVKVGGKPSPV